MKFQGIQILRAIAALTVAASHLSLYSTRIFHFDFAILDFFATHAIISYALVLFFGISGFVMAHAMRAAPPGEFLLLRLLRLYPTYWFAALAVMALKLIRDGHYNVSALQIVTGLFLMPRGDNVHFALSVEWTLIYELFFYLAITLFAWIGGYRGFLIGCGLWLAAIVIRCVVWPNQGMIEMTARLHWSNVPLSGWHIPTLIGVFAYQIRERSGTLALGWKFLAVTLLFHSYLYAQKTELWLVMEGVAAALMIWWFADMAIADTHFLVRLGDASYGIYLLHVPIIIAYLELMHDRFGWVGPGSWNLLPAAWMLVLSIGFAYGWFESKMYRRMRKWAGRNSGRAESFECEGRDLNPHSLAAART